MTTKPLTHDQIRNSDVIHAFAASVGRKKAYGKAGRVVSGLLKAAVKAGQIRKTEHISPFNVTVRYHMTDEQVEQIRQEAIARAQAD